MPASFSLWVPLIWAQSFIQGFPERFRGIAAWIYLLGEPTVTIGSASWSQALLGGLITWVKVMSLFALLGWVASWLSTALKERTVAKGSWLDYALLVAVVGGIGTMLLKVLETSEWIPIYKFAGIYIVNILASVWFVIALIWVEYALWSIIARFGKKGDLFVMFGLHVALIASVAFGLYARVANNALQAGTVRGGITLAEGLVFGFRMAATFMGYVILIKVASMLTGELVAIRFRRLYSIARVTVIESNRRMWAPYVVVTVFLVILAFTHWFLQPPRAAEMGRLFVGTLTLLSSLLLTVMITLLTPLSLPQDIQNQTIYTIVSKPVRRIELIWGRMFGFMAIVTVLVVVFGGISLLYLSRTVGGTIAATELAAVKADKENKIPEARQLREQAQQLRTRMAARVPIYGVLTFLDSKGTPHLKGIDVGQEQSMREPRSHIEGATPATAIWTFGVMPDPMTPPSQRPELLDRRVPVDQFLKGNTVEALSNRVFELRYQILDAERDLATPNLPAATANQLTKQIAAARDELMKATDAYNKLKAQSEELEAEAKKPGAGDDVKAKSAALHSQSIPMEMTFNVYRTTKGRVGDPVYASLLATNPRTGQEYQYIFPIREYYTNKVAIPASLLVGSAGNLKVEIRCMNSTQYLGMAQSDLFLLTSSGNFGENFMKGLFGIWLQAMVLTAIGVFAGTFLSWPVALLTTIFFFVAGQVAFAFLLDFTRQSLLGGGPFESLIRLLTHDNQMSDLNPTIAVVTAKTFDSIVMPIMSRLVYIVPNFAALDVSNVVADGFAVSWILLLSNLLLALAYALPFSIAGYFILKNREVAA